MFLEITGNLPCHPDAAVFKKDFKNKREELARKLFNLYNKEIFENKVGVIFKIKTPKNLVHALVRLLNVFVRCIHTIIYNVIHTTLYKIF